LSLLAKQSTFTIGDVEEDFAMVSWIVRALLAIAGVITAWFIATDSPNFDLVRAAIAVLLLAFVIAVLAFWPKRWRF
jgi:uncharacterized membrane protein